MSSIFATDIRRSISHSLGRWIAIATIAALGCGFYAGLRMTAPDMDIAADAYFDETAFMDVRVVSSYGLTDDDIAALEGVKLVDEVMPAYETDIMGTVAGEQYALRVHSLSPSAYDSIPAGVGVASGDEAYLNRLVLEEGRWPVAAGECVIAADKVMAEPINIGDEITITQCTQTLEDTLNVRAYTVVGTVTTPYYLCSSTLGTTTLGGGSIQQYLYVPESDFCDGLPYTEAFITVQGARELQNGSAEYKKLVSKAVGRIKSTATIQEDERTAQVKAQYQEGLDAKWAEFEASKTAVLARFAAAKAQLEDAARQLQAGHNTLSLGQTIIDITEQALKDLPGVAQGLVEEGKDKIAAAVGQGEGSALQQGEGFAADSQALGEVASNDIPAAQDLDEGGRGQVSSALSLEEAFAGIDQALGEISVPENSLSSDLSLENLSIQNIPQVQETLDSYSQELADATAQYNQAVATYNTQYQQAMAQLDEAQAQLEAAQAQLDAMEGATWYLLDRTKNFGAESFSADADRVDSIAAVFPFIFFLVAALVSLTTMTRMVEEERVLIGTYKALGFSKRRIASKYLIYAASASIIGSAIGIAVLSQVLPRVIMGAYAIIYTVPAQSYPIDVPLTVLAAGLGIGITLLATLGAVLTTLREKPAALMLPRAPKAGKRILLERIEPVWRHLSFSWKVTFRNLFRYKRRFIMTVIGIAGCTALLLTGWGLRNAINDIIDKQFYEVLQYSGEVTINPDMSEESRTQLNALLADDDYVADYTWVRSETMLAQPEGTHNVTVGLVTVKSTAEFEDFVVLRNRVSQEELSLDEGGVVITEKLATKMGVEVGDAISLYGQDAIGNPLDVEHTFTVSGIAEYYVGNCAYISAQTYREVFHAAPQINKVILKAPDDASMRKALTLEAQAIDGVKTAGFNDENVDSYRTMLKSVDLIVWVLVIAAAALAFVVLYNLININIAERIREIATLKVLGFTPREVQAYIYRETMLLSIIGALVGLVLGIFMEDFVVVTAEVEQVMFGRSIHLESFIISFVLTLVFTLLAMLFMRPKLTHVSMVESLKSTE